jgi:carbonic anhydrase/acetyltransferase-like protein (isoleucine patch superfamily)
MADGASDGMRALYLKITGALDSTCTITLAPNDIDKVWIIENATSDSGSSGPYSIIISQGSGSNVTIGNSKVSVLYTDGGAGSAAVVDALADLELSSTLTVAGASTLTGAVTMSGDASVGDDLTLVSDAAVLNFGVNSDVSLTHVHDTGLLLNSTRQLQFNDSSQYISGTSATVLSIAATDEIDLTATAVDLNGTLDVSGVSTLNGVLHVKSRTDLYASTGPTLAAQLGGGSDIGLNTSSADADFNIKCVGEFAVSAGSSSTTNFFIAGTAASFTGTLGVTGATTLTGDVSIATDVIIGTNPSSAGDIRLNKNFGIFTRNNANDANKAIISENTVTGNDTLDFGDNGKWSALRFHCSTANVMELTATAINLNKAVTMNNAAIKMTGLATSDPGVAGQLWNDSNTVKVSAG